MTQHKEYSKHSDMFNYRAVPVPINPNWKELVSSLVEKRNKMQLSQEALAYKIGCADSLIGKWERYERLPSGFMLLDWIEALDCKLKVQ